MRKYALPKAVYVILIAILLILSIDYTYAYFSASVIATGKIKLNSINVSWRDENSNMAQLPTLFDNPATSDVNEALSIQIISELKRGGYVQIQANDVNGVKRNIKLNISNLGTTGAYCRVRLNGTYTNKAGEQKNCEDDWLKLALTSGANKKFITNSGWFYDNSADDGVGYYYYGESLNSLTELTKNTALTFADYIYLSSDSNVDMFGASLVITLTLDAVQSSNNAYKSVWGL